MLPAWSTVNLGRYGDAERIFKAVSRTGYSDEALRGLNVIGRRIGLIRD